MNATGERVEARRDLDVGLTGQQISQLERATRRENFARAWYKFSRNRLSVVGGTAILIILLLAIFAPVVAPYPQHAEAFVDFANASKAPSLAHPFGTDEIGRDILSRILFAFRNSLIIGIVVLSVVVPFGVAMGLVAGYYQGTWVDSLIMRLTDIFLAVPSLILALAIASILEPNQFNAMLAVTVSWWPWYSRLVYGLTTTLRTEDYVIAAELMGASTPHILFRELLPSSTSTILTKASLDMGWVILIGAALSFVGLGVQPPTPGLGTMVASGAKFLPDLWWIATFPGLAIVFVVLAFNLFGDGVRDVLAAEGA